MRCGRAAGFATDAATQAERRLPAAIAGGMAVAFGAALTTGRLCRLVDAQKALAVLARATFIETGT
ncbi:hypothetical protein CK216_24895 [Mesorhizobium sp. WSM3876]|nr:hypothetical protein CK216_24895 [Mesorhizobium sp. WSM3876]